LQNLDDCEDFHFDDQPRSDRASSIRDDIVCNLVRKIIHELQQKRLLRGINRSTTFRN